MSQDHAWPCPACKSATVYGETYNGYCSEACYEKDRTPTDTELLDFFDKEFVQHTGGRAKAWAISVEVPEGLDIDTITLRSLLTMALEKKNDAGS